MSEYDFHAPSQEEIHRQWHEVNPNAADCPLDCQASDQAGDAELIEGLRQGIAEGEYVRFEDSALAPEDEVDLDTVDVSVDAPLPEGNTATERQVAFMRDLIREREHIVAAEDIAAEARQAWRQQAFTRKIASATIDRLLAIRKPERVADSIPAAREVPEGRYAIEFPDAAPGTNTMRFFKVDRPDQGRWEGYVFVSRMQSDDERRISRAEQVDVLRRIAEDPQAAALRYGRELEECSVCGKSLTNDDSRAAGIGPTCAAKRAW